MPLAEGEEPFLQLAQRPSELGLVKSEGALQHPAADTATAGDGCDVSQIGQSAVLDLRDRTPQTSE